VTDPPDVADAVRRGVRPFNRGRYLDAQAVWEEAWRAAPADARGLLEGLVQLAGSLHLRTRRGATRGAVHLLAQALVLLEEYRPAAHGLDVDALVGDFGAFLEWMRGTDRPHRLLDRLRIPRLR
jgi:predicted metal-dependent hydrolase